LGVYHRDLETWFLLASRYALSAPGPAGITAKTAPPVRLAGILNNVALGGTEGVSRRYFGMSSQWICRSIAAAQSSVSNLPVLPATGMNATSPFGCS
jgi:hypothetical protein